MIKLWGWDKKPRTMLRYIKLGDIFCFEYDDHTYCFGRIMAKVQFYIVEILDYTSEQPIISEDEWRTLPWLSPLGDYLIKQELADKLKGK